MPGTGLSRILFLTVAFVAVYVGIWFARSFGPWAPRGVPTDTSRAIFDQILGPAGCPPRLVEGRIAVGCDKMMLPEAQNVGGAVDEIAVAGRALTVRGWAVDAARGEPARLVLIAVDGTVALWAPLGKSRDDVAKVFGKSAYGSSGYNVEASIPEGFKRLEHEIRVYGITAEGAAGELTQGEGAKAR